MPLQRFEGAIVRKANGSLAYSSECCCDEGGGGGDPGGVNDCCNPEVIGTIDVNVSGVIADAARPVQVCGSDGSPDPCPTVFNGLHTVPQVGLCEWKDEYYFPPSCTPFFPQERIRVTITKEGSDWILRVVLRAIENLSGGRTATFETSIHTGLSGPDCASLGAISVPFVDQTVGGAPGVLDVCDFSGATVTVTL